MNYAGVDIKAFLVLFLLIANGCEPSTQMPRPVKEIAWKFETDRTDYKPKNLGKVIRPSYTSNTDLENINKVAVLVTSTSPLFGRIVEDQLSVNLKDKGFDVVEQSKIYELTLEELRREELIRLKEQLKLEENIEEDKEGLDRGIGPAIVAGKKLRLDALIMGEVDERRRPASFDRDGTPTTVEKLVVLTFNVQIIDVRTEETRLSVTLRYDEGEDIISATNSMTEIITDEIGIQRSL